MEAQSEPYLKRNSRCVVRIMLVDDVIISQYDNVAMYLLGDALRPSRRRNRQPYSFAKINRKQEKYHRQNRRNSNDSSNRHRRSTTTDFFSFRSKSKTREGQQSLPNQYQTKTEKVHARACRKRCEYGGFNKIYRVW